MGIVDDLHRAHHAYERHEWLEAFQSISELDESKLSAADFFGLAMSAYLLGRRDDCVHALQRAFQSSLAANDLPAAALSAYWLATTLWQAGELAVGNGWLARIERLLDEAGDVAEWGYLFHAQMMQRIQSGNFAEAFAIAPKIAEYGYRFAKPDLVALGLNSEGRLMLYAGNVAEGLQRMDESLVGVMAGEVSAVIAGQVYCTTIEGCQEVSDFARAGQWTRALTTWCNAQPELVAYTGQCAVHRGQLMRLHGAYADAIEELRHAVERYRASGGGPAVGMAHYERGEVHRLRGEFSAADEAYAEAAEFGHPAQPGRALLGLARGRRVSAASVANRLLAEYQDPVHRSQILPAAVEILVATDELEFAATLVEELSRLGEEFRCSGLRAAGHFSLAMVELERGSVESAVSAARRAVDAWSELSAPYEVARSRALLGRALKIAGDNGAASAELDSAQQAITALGVDPMGWSVAGAVRADSTLDGLTPREREVLGLVAEGKSNRKIAQALTLSEKTVARHMSNIFAKLNVESRTAAAAYVFEHRMN